MANQEVVYRRRCGNYEQPEEGDDEGVLRGIITYEPIPINEQVVMFINENRVFECYTVNEVRQGVIGRNVLPLTNRPLGDNFQRQFNARERTFFIVEDEEQGIHIVREVIPINRDIFFHLIANDPVRGNPPPLTQRIIDNEGGIRRDIAVLQHQQQRMLENNEENRNRLRDAVRDNNMEMVRYLVENGIRDNIILYVAVENNNMEILRYLVENGMRYNNAVHLAVFNNNMDIVRYLVENGMQCDQCIRLAVDNNNMEMVRFLVENGMRDALALDYARARNLDDIVAFLEQHNFDGQF